MKQLGKAENAIFAMFGANALLTNIVEVVNDKSELGAGAKRQFKKIIKGTRKLQSDIDKSSEDSHNDAMRALKARDPDFKEEEYSPLSDKYDVLAEFLFECTEAWISSDKSGKLDQLNNIVKTFQD